MATTTGTAEPAALSNEEGVRRRDFINIAAVSAAGIGGVFYYVSFNMKDKLVGQNRYLRQALSSAIDRDSDRCIASTTAGGIDISRSNCCASLASAAFMAGLASACEA